MNRSWFRLAAGTGPVILVVIPTPAAILKFVSPWISVSIAGVKYPSPLMSAYISKLPVTASVVLFVIIAPKVRLAQLTRPVTPIKPAEYISPQFTQCATCARADWLDQRSATSTTGVPHITGTVAVTP